MHVRAWRRLDGTDGRAVGRLAADGDGWIAHGAEVLAGDTASACRLHVELDDLFRTRRATVEVMDADGSRAVEAVVRDGRWRIDGVDCPDLADAVDIDVAATPLTNTFPIRRLGRLDAGDSRTVVAAWVDVPSLAVTRVAQTYRKLEPVARWEYSDAVFGAFELEVDDAGLVVWYEGLYGPA